MLVLGILIGLSVGIVVGLAFAIDKLEEKDEDLRTQILLRRNRDKFINYIMNRNTELKQKNIDLENNIEILINNLSAQKKKLVRPDNQD